MSEALTHINSTETNTNSVESQERQSEKQEQEFTSLLNGVENLTPKQTKDLLEKVVNPEDLQSFQEQNSKRVMEMLKNTKNLDYFGIEQAEFLQVQNELKELNLDINQVLEQYSKYIDTKLDGLNQNQKDKIKLVIKRKILKLGGDIKEQKDDLKSGEDFKKNRWIINSRLQENFAEINNKILPSAEILSQYNKGDKPSSRENGLYSLDDKIEEIQKMFNSEVLENGEFDKTWRSGEVIDANTNNWNVVDSTDKMDSRFLKEKGVKQVEGISLLSPEDKKIEEKAMLYFMAMIGVQIGVETIGGIPGTLVGGGVDLYDTFSKDEALLEILQGLDLVSDNYKMDKTALDNILAGIGMIPGMTQIVKGSKLADFMKKVDKKAFENAKNEIKAKLGISEKIEKIVKFSKEELKRINIGETELGRKLDTNEKKAIIEAHNIGERGEDLKYGLGDLKQKVIVLQKAGFNNSEIKVLFDKNICGTEFPKFKPLYEDPRYDFLEKYRDILGDKLSEKDIIGEGNNGIILKHPSKNDKVLKIAKEGEDIDKLDLEYVNHREFEEILFKLKSLYKDTPKGILLEKYFVPNINKVEKGVFEMEKINGLSYKNLVHLDFHKNNLNDIDNKNITDSDLEKILDKRGLVKHPLSETIEDEMMESMSTNEAKDFLTQIYGIEAIWEKSFSRDIKPLLNILEENGFKHNDEHWGNFMKTLNGEIYIIDFGRSKITKIDK